MREVSIINDLINDPIIYNKINMFVKEVIEDYECDFEENELYDKYKMYQLGSSELSDLFMMFVKLGMAEVKNDIKYRE